jgi:DNA-binding transcriptional MerR regulator
MGDRDVLRIGDLATRTGLSRDALRYYERVGLMPATRRTSGGFRVYPAATLDRIRFIKQAQKHGLSLTEIRELLRFQDSKGTDRCRQVHRLLTRKLMELEEQVAQLQEFQRVLRGYLQQCERTQALSQGDECPVVVELSKAEE